MDKIRVKKLLKSARESIVDGFYNIAISEIYRAEMILFEKKE